MVVDPPTAHQLHTAAPWLAERYAAGDPDRLVRVTTALLGWLAAALERADGRPRTDAQPAPHDLAVDDWPLWLEMAQGEGIAPLVYWEVGQAGQADRLPTAVWSALRKTSMATAVRNLRFFQMLDEVLAQLAEAGIPVIVLKGPALARTIYPSALLRPMSDLDILVHSRQVADAVAVLLRHGWARHVLLSQEFQEVAGPNIPLWSPPGFSPPLLLEIHWVLIGTQFYRRREPADWAWGACVARALSFSGRSTARSVHLLDPAATALYQAAHAYWRHRYDDRSLLALWDIARAAAVALAEPDGANRLVAAARETGWATPLRAALEDARAVLHLELPDGLPAALMAAEDAYGRGLYDLKTQRDASMTADVALPLFYALNWSGRLEFVRSTLWPSREYLIWRFAERPGRWTRLPLRARWWAQLGGDLLAFLATRLGGRQGAATGDN